MELQFKLLINEVNMLFVGFEFLDFTLRFFFAVNIVNKTNAVRKSYYTRVFSL